MRALRTLALVAFLLGSLADVSAATTLTTFSMNASAVGTDPQGMTVSETKTSVPGVTGFSDSAIAGAASADLFADVDVAGDAITVLVNAAANRAAAQSIRARAEAVIEFTLTQRATYALEALVEASGGASAGSSVDVATVFHAEQLGSPGQRVFSRRGSLAAGSYRIEVTCFAEGPTGVEKSARCGIALQIPAQTGPGIRWKRPGSGSFATGANWDPAQVPGAGDAAIFDLPRAYTVTVGDQSTDQLLVSRGKPAFVAGQYTVTGESESTQVTGGAVLALGTGCTLRGDSAFIGETTVSAGSQVALRAPTALWSLTGALSVGREGAGALAVTAGALATPELFIGDTGLGGVAVSGPASELQAESVTVGLGESAVLSIRGGAIARSDEALLGFSGDTTHFADVLVDGAAPGGGAVSKWQVGTIRMIGGCPSQLTVRKGAVVEVSGSLEVGGPFNAPPSPAVVTVEQRGAQNASLRVPGSLRIGAAALGGGSGELRVRTGGEVVCEDELVIAEDGSGVGTQTARGTLDVAGGTFTVAGGAGAVAIGSGLGARGTLRVTNGGTVAIDVPRATQVGVLNGTGEVLVGGVGAGSTFSTFGNVEIGFAGSGEVRVFPGSRLAAVGVVTVHALGVLVGERQVSAAAVVRAKPARVPTKAAAAPPARIECDELVNHGTIAPGGLTVDGEFTQGDDGTLVAAIAGDTAQDQDRLVVTGAASLGGRLVLQFTNGYAPRTGDSFTVVDTAGATTGAFADVEVAGLAPGAQIDASIVDGELIATARNDTVALPTVSLRAKAKKAFEKRPRPVNVVVRRKGDTTAPLTVTYAASGSAADGGEYEALGGTVVIPAGKRSASFAVLPIDDAEPESTETLALRIVPGADYTPSSKSRAALTLVDDDAPWTTPDRS